MRTHTETKILPYTAEQMFDLVIAVDQYPEFLPWCIGARINEKKKNEINADVIVGYKIFREKFTSRVYFKRPTEIEVDYLRGPLRNLHNKWVFKNLRGGKCQVDFSVSFEFSSSLLEKIADQFFHVAFTRMVSAFEKRAAALYS